MNFLQHCGNLVTAPVFFSYSTIFVAANHDIIAGVLENIKQYMAENTVLEKFINMDTGTANLLERQKKPDLTKIEDDFKDYSVKLIPGKKHKPG